MNASTRYIAECARQRMLLAISGEAVAVQGPWSDEDFDVVTVEIDETVGRLDYFDRPIRSGHEQVPNVRYDLAPNS